MNKTSTPKKDKRPLELVVISDVHLGTRACHAKELLQYLKSIKPSILVLNGDIIDIWQFHKNYWPKSHMKVVKYIIGLATKGTKVYYVTGNHDELIRKFAGMKLGLLKIVNKLTIKIGNKRAWIFHGDVFDVIIQYSKWLAKLGAFGYDSLVRINVFVNKIRKFFGRDKVSISKKIKENVKSALKYIFKFEETAASMAAKKGFGYIICGHIHYPEMKTINTNYGEVKYLNSGDWVENLSALEYNKGKWDIYYYKKEHYIQNDVNKDEDKAIEMVDMNNKEVFNAMLKEFNV